MKSNIINMCAKGLLSCALIVAGSASLPSCTEVEPEFVYPQKEKSIIYFSEDKTVHELKFTAADTWELSSSAKWCKFMDASGDVVPTLSGAAGEQTVKVVATEEGQQMGGADDLAVINMSIHGRVVVLAEVLRSPEGYSLSLHQLNEDGSQAESAVIEAGCDDYLHFVVKANYDFFISSKPEWVEFEDEFIGGKAGQEVSFGIRVVTDPAYKKYSVEASDENLIIFASNDGKAFSPVQVTYAGLPEDYLYIDTTFPADGWNVSLDGKTFLKETESMMGDGNTIRKIFYNKIDFAVETRNDDVVPVYLEYRKVGDTKKFQVVDAAKSFMHIDNQAGQLSLTVTASDAKRKGKVFLFAKGEYDKLDLSKGADLFYNNGILKDEYFEHLFIELNQKNLSAGEAFKIQNAGTMSSVEYTEYDGVEDFPGITDVYTFEPMLGAFYIIDPLHEVSGWDEEKGEGVVYFEVTDKDGKVVVSNDDFFYEPSMGLQFSMLGQVPAGNFYKFTFTDPVSGAKKILLIDHAVDASID